MTRKSFLTGVLLMAGLIVTAPAVYAAGPEENAAPEKNFFEKMHAKMDGELQELYQELNLSEEQKRLLDENKNQNRAETKKFFQELRAKKDLMQQELQKPALDMAKVTQINNELKALQGHILDQRLQGILQVRKILTPEQFNRFMTKMEAHRKEARHKWGDKEAR